MSLDDIEKQISHFHGEKKKEEKPLMSPSAARDTAAFYEERKAREREEQKADDGWRADEEKKSSRRGGTRHSPFMKITGFVVGILAIAAVGVGAVIYVVNTSSGGKDVSVDLYAPTQVYRGVPFDVTVQVASQPQSSVRGATLTITMTPGIVSLDNLNPSNQNLVIDPVGDLGGGSLTKRNYKFLATGDANSVQKLTVQLSYASGGGSARYAVKQEAQVAISDPAIGLTVKEPSSVVGGSKFDLEVGYRNVSGFDFPDVRIQANYPPEYQFASASITPDSLQRYWRLGELKSGSAGKLTVTGSFRATEQGTFNIPFDIFVNFLGHDYLVGEQVATITLSPSPVALALAVNGQSDYVAHASDLLQYRITYQNNSGIALANATIKVSLLGAMYNFATLRTDGNFSSVANTITWNAGNMPALNLVEPGASGEVDFTVQLSSLFPINRLSDRNFTLQAKATLESPTVPYYISADKTSSVASLTTKIGALASLTAKALYRDAASGIANSGTLPPRVNTPTEYTVHWTIRNYPNDLTNVKITAPLAAGVEWTGIEKSSIDSVPLYDSQTGIVTWTIAKIPATTGVASAPIEGTFQIKATPNVTQVRQYEPLMGQATLSGTDDFTGQPYTTTAQPLDTSLPADPTVGQGQGIVTQ